MGEIILNNKQEEAVNSNSKHNLVISGAGTGKTSVITKRYLKLIEKYDPSSIVLLSFSKKAAKEMTQRIEKETKINNSHCGTFHSFGFKIIREHEILENPVFLDEKLELMLFKDFVRKFELKKEYIEAFFKQIKKVKTNGLFYYELIVDENNYTEKLFKKIYENYQKYLLENNFLSYEDMLLLPLEKLKTDRELAKKIASKISNILIDEFQDTSFLQINFLKELTNNNEKINIFAVGDDDQSIYGFRDSRIENILNFKDFFKETKIIKLEENYRSDKKILELANKLIKNNRFRYEKNLFTNNEDKENKNINFKLFFDREKELNWILREIKLYQEKSNEDSILILLRYNYQIKILANFLTNNDIEINSSSDEKLNKDLIFDILIILQAINSNNQSFIDFCENTLKKYNKEITINDLSSIKFPFEIIEIIFSEFKNESIEYLLSLARNYYDIDDFLENIDNLNNNSSKVKIYSYHAAKGLEADYVIMPYLEQESFFSKNNINLEEERRIFYVGITRAKEKISFSYSQTSLYFSNVKYNNKLIFLDELGF